MNDNIFIFNKTGTIILGIKDRDIKNVTIPNSVTNIRDGVFERCEIKA